MRYKKLNKAGQWPSCCFVWWYSKSINHQLFSVLFSCFRFPFVTELVDKKRWGRTPPKEQIFSEVTWGQIFWEVTRGKIFFWGNLGRFCRDNLGRFFFWGNFWGDFSEGTWGQIFWALWKQNVHILWPTTSCRKVTKDIEIAKAASEFSRRLNETQSGRLIYFRWKHFWTLPLALPRRCTTSWWGKLGKGEMGRKQGKGGMDKNTKAPRDMY